MRLIKFCKDRTVLVECEQCKSIFKSSFVLMERDGFYSVEIDYKYCPYCSKLLKYNREEMKNEKQR